MVYRTEPALNVYADILERYEIEVLEDKHGHVLER